MADFLEAFAVLISIAIVDKKSVTAVDGLHADGVLDGAPMLLGAPGDFLHIGDQAIDVGTIGAIQLFNGVEITEPRAIHRNVFIAVDLGDAINGKADELIETHHHVQRDGGDDAGPDDGSSHDAQNLGIAEIIKQALSQFAVSCSGALLEEHILVLDAVAKFRGLFLGLVEKIGFQLFELSEQGVEFFVDKKP